MNDNEIYFRVLFALYSRKYTRFPKYHHLQDLLGVSGLTTENVNKVQVNIERLNGLGMGKLVSYVKKTGPPHYLSDIEIEVEGVNRVEKLIRNTISDPSPLKLTEDEMKSFSVIQKETDSVKQSANFCNFILKNKHHFFETQSLP